MRILKVIWDDAGQFRDSDCQWLKIEEVLKLYGESSFVQNSFGYLVHEDISSMILAQSLDMNDGEHQYSGLLRIPKCCVISTHDIRVME